MSKSSSGRERERERERDRDRDRERARDKHYESRGGRTDYDNGKSSRNGAGLSSSARSGGLREERKRTKDKDGERGAAIRRDEKRRKRSRSKDYDKDKRQMDRERDKEKERERERERERDRERERQREREKERERERDKDRERERERQREPDTRRPIAESILVIPVASSSSSSDEIEEEEIDKEEQQRRLEQEMIKRRERIERWRAERKQRDQEDGKKDAKVVVVPTAVKSAKKWSLEDESSEDESSNPAPVIDLDAEKKEPDSPPSKFHSIRKRFDDDVVESKFSPLKRPTFSKVLGMSLGAPPTDSAAALPPPPPPAKSPSEPAAPAPTTATSTSTFTSGKPSSEAMQVAEIKKEPQEKSTDTEAAKPPDAMEVAEDNKKPKVEETKAESDDDVDPLDAYMLEVNNEMRRVNNFVGPGPSQGVMVLEGVAKKKAVTVKKGELIEQNMDSLEYSSEDELEDIRDTANSLAMKHRKELAKIDHSSVSYAPFRKNFYVEVPELARMTPADVEKYRTELEGIQVKGKGCPKPIKTWAQCGVSKKEMEVLRRMGFEKPTPIQCQAIPTIMSGRDLIGIAKTGSGKTLAFILPMFRHILDQPVLEDGDGALAIIMAPTRELCMQIGKDIRKFSRPLGLRPVCVYGGTGISEQIAELKRGSEIIVCTPGRMIDMLAANSGRVTNLRRVTYIVLDEADRMFDMGFEPQVMRIIDNVRPDRQTVMFSATFPRQMEALARRILKRPVEVIVGGRSVVCKDVEQHVVLLNDDAKFFKLLELLGVYQETGSIIVFTDKQENADTLLRDLMKASYPCMSLHGGIDQFDRDSTIIDFKSGKVRLLIATSVAARGLDVKDLILVVNYDVPNHYEDYVHRCGRTGRAGKKGSAYTFITPEQARYSGDIVRALELSGTPVPPDLTRLWTEYKAAQEAEGKKVHTGGGFSGKGFKFDEQEFNAVKESKKLQKAALGLADSDDEEDIEQDIDMQIEQIFAAKRTVKDTSVAATALAAANAAVSAAVSAQANAATATPHALAQAQQQQQQLQAQQPVAGAAVGSDKLELAKRLASKISSSRNLDTKSTQVANDSLMKGQPGAAQPAPMLTARTVVEQLAAKLNNKLNYQPKDDEDGFGSSLGSNSNSFTKYEEELEINDFPQQARWKVTSKEALAQISEYSEAGLTVRGTYVPQGKSPPEGERKLYLAIESCSELAVQKAKREITRLIKEELLKLSSAHHVFNKGRYKVV
ncbi:CG6227 [Drosophila busckii]|uniref:Probable ATP-dependent RNA helicase DDX46 n=1 Tax=Drosophila busckii TaxID=30019 RepID=A0A0M4EZR6_DROBS|nr:probable ATP-dependent RNA helicase DDX46 [Drosophila busckii]ALC49742.1 CG6227 [Drosophila busckii]